MKCLSLWAPWAQLIRIGEKRIETRSWGTSYRGWILIHCAKKIIPNFGQICHERPFCDALESSGYTEMDDYEADFGRVIAAARLYECVPTEKIWWAISAREISFGDYSPGRFAWVLTDVTPLRPFAARGRQRLFDVDVPGWAQLEIARVERQGD